MAFLSRYSLSHRDSLELRLVDSYAVHQAVYSLFDGQQRERILFVDRGVRDGRRQILIQSAYPPIIGVFGEISTKHIPDSYLDFDVYNFETVVNPVLRNNTNNREIVKPVRDRNEIVDWFAKRALQWGFRPVDVEVVRNWADNFRKRDREITLSKARLVGALEVLDRDLFKKAFYSGLGRGKGFGCGLLQLQRIQSY